MNRIHRRIVGAALALAGGVSVIGVVAPAADAAPVTPAFNTWACAQHGHPQLQYGAGYHDGMQPAVREIQCLLSYSGHHVTQDGLFGLDTRKKVVQFQFAHGLNPDGIVGRYTWAALEKYNKQVRA